MRFHRPSLSHLLLCAFILASLGATALGLRSILLALPLLLVTAAIFFRVSLPGWTSLVLRWMVRAGTAAAVVMGLIQTLYPVIPEPVIFGVSTVLAYVLVFTGSILLVARTPPAQGILPATFGALIGAFIQAGPSGLRVATAVAMCLLMAWLATSDDEGGSVAPARLLPLLVFVSLSAGIAFGITALLPWAQPKVEVALAQMISNDLSAEAGLSLESSLGDVEKLALSKRVALRLYGDRPEDLRVRAFTSFDLRAWHADPRPRRRLTPASVPPGRWPGFDDTPGTAFAETARFPGEGLRSCRLVVRAPERGAMPAPAHSVAVKIEDVNVDRTPSGILIPTDKAALYAVLYAESDPGEGAPGPEMLEVPKNLDARLRALAASIAPPDLSAVDRVDCLTSYFQGSYRYSLEVGPFRTRDPVAEFVFDKKKGYCEYFATATTLLLRLSGVPARYVTGYAVRSFQRSGSFYLVRDADAHAWSEAWLPGRGWVEVDATPAGDYEALHGGVDTGGWWARVQSIFDEVSALVAQGGALGAARTLAAHPAPVAAAVIALAIWRIRKVRWSRARAKGGKKPAVFIDPLRPLTRGLLARVDARCAARGAPRSPARAPLEHLKDQDIPLDPGERAACLRVVEALYEEAYGGAPLAALRVQDLSAGLQALDAAAVRPQVSS